MSIIRVSKNKENPYLIMNKTCLNDNRLSLKAKGLLCYLLSKPDNWYVSTYDLIKNNSNGIESIRSTIKELIKFGYMEKHQFRNHNGRYYHYNYLVYEVPKKLTPIKITTQPKADFPCSDKPCSDNRTLLINDKYLNNDLNNIESSNKSSINNVVYENLNLEKLKQETKLLLFKLGIRNYQYFFETFKISDIFIYADWMLSKNSFFVNPAGFLTSALKNRWTDSELQKNLIV